MDLNATARDIRERFGSSIQKASDTYGVSPDLLAAIAAVESGGNPHAVSPKGAVGMWQFMPQTAMDYGLDDRTDPDKSAMAAGKLYADLLKRYDGNVDLAVAAGNAGPGRVDSGEYQGIRETVMHMERVREALGMASADNEMTGEESWRIIQKASGHVPVEGEITDQREAGRIFALANLQSAALQVPRMDPSPEAAIDLAQKQDSGFLKRYVLGGGQQFVYGMASMIPTSMATLGAVIDKVADDVAMRDVSFDQLAKAGLSWNDWLEKHVAVENPNFYHQLVGALGNMAWFAGGGLLAARGAGMILAGEQSLAPSLVAKLGDAIGWGVMTTLESAVEQGDAIQKRMESGMSPADALEDSREVFWENQLLIGATNIPYWTPGSRAMRIAIEAISEGPIQERTQKAIQDVADGTGTWGDLLDYHYAWQEGLIGAIVGGGAAGLMPDNNQDALRKKLTEVEKGKRIPTERLEGLVATAEAEAGIKPPTDQATLGQRVEAILAMRRPTPPPGGGGGTAARIGEILGQIQGRPAAAAEAAPAPPSGGGSAILPQDEERDQRRAKLDALGDQIELEQRFLAVQDAVGRVLGTEVDLEERLTPEQLADVRDRIGRAFGVKGEAHQRYAVQQLVMKVRGMLLGTSPQTTSQETAAGQQQVKDDYRAARAAELQRRAEEREAKAAAAELMAAEMEAQAAAEAQRKEEQGKARAAKKQAKEATDGLMGDLAGATTTVRQPKVITPIEAIETVRKHLEAAYKKPFKMSDLGDELDDVAAEAATAMSERDPVLRARLFDRVAERAENLLLDRGVAAKINATNMPKAQLTSIAHPLGQKLATDAATTDRDVGHLQNTPWTKARKAKKSEVQNIRKFELLANLLGVQVTFYELTQFGIVNKGTMGMTIRNRHIMVNMYDEQGPIVSTLVHEAVHNMRDHSPAEYKRLFDLVASTGFFASKQAEIDAMLAHYPQGDRQEEMLCDIVGSALNSETFLRELAKRDMPLLKKFLKHLREVIAVVKGEAWQKSQSSYELFKKVLSDVDAMEQQISEIMAEYVEKTAKERVQDVIAKDRAQRKSKLPNTEDAATRKMLSGEVSRKQAEDPKRPGASATPATAPPMHVNKASPDAIFEAAITSTLPAEIDIAMSYRTLDSHLAKLMKFLDDPKAFSVEEIKLAIPSIKMIQAELAKHPDLNTTFAEKIGALVDNEFEKSLTFELNGNGPRRAVYEATINALDAKVAEVRPWMPMLTADELLSMAAWFHVNGKIAPCMICYVEAARRPRQDAINGFITGDYSKKKSRGLPTYLDEQQYPERARLIKKHGKLPSDLMTNIDKYRSDPEYAGVVKELGRYAGGATKARRNDVKNAEYKGNILDDTFAPGGVQRTKLDNPARSHWGLMRGMRFSGSNDFVIDQVLDWMQAVLDLSVRGMSAYAYTKVDSMVKIFYKTGMHINQSVAVNLKDGADPSTAKMDIVNGMDWKAAQENRKLGPNVGCVIVCSNDTQIAWALEQDWIDTIIPVHHAGVTKEQQKLMDSDRYDGNPGIKRVEAKFGGHPNYSRITNDMRNQADSMVPLKPIFDYDYAMKELKAFYDAGGWPSIATPDRQAIRHAIRRMKAGKEAFDQRVVATVVDKSPGPKGEGAARLQGIPSPVSDIISENRANPAQAEAVQDDGPLLSFNRVEPTDTEEMKHFRERQARATEKEKKSGKQVLIGIYDWLRTTMVTRDHPLYSLVERSMKRIEKNVRDLDWTKRPDLVLRATRTWATQGTLALKKGVYSILDDTKKLWDSVEDIVAKHDLAPWIDSGHFQQFWQAADHVAREDKLGNAYFPSKDVDPEAYNAAVKEFQLYKRLYEAYKITHPKWVDAVKDLTGFSNSMIQRMHEAGILSKKEYDDITSKYDVFSPMELLDLVERSFQSEDSAMDKESKVVRTRGLFEAGKVRADPFNSLIKNVYRMEYTISQHRAHMSLVEHANYIRQNGGDADDICVEYKPRKYPIMKASRELLAQMGIRVEGSQTYKDTYRKVLKREVDAEGIMSMSGEDKAEALEHAREIAHGEAYFAAQPEFLAKLEELGMKGLDAGLTGFQKIWAISAIQETGAFAVIRNSRVEYYKADEQIVGLFNGFLKSPGILKYFAAQTALLRGGAVLTPEFMARNPIRDLAHAGIIAHSLVNNPLDAIKLPYLVFDGLREAIRQGSTWREWVIMGGPESEMVAPDLANVRAKSDDFAHGRGKEYLEYAKKHPSKFILAHSPIRALQIISIKTEQATRLAVYKKVKSSLLAKGYSLEEAKFQAMIESREASIDFATAGTLGRQINMMIPFFNAGVQAQDKMWRTLMRDPGKEGAWLKSILMIMAPSLLLWAKNHDEEWYKDLPYWMKNMFWVFSPDGGKTVVKIPKPFELGMIFGSLPERALEFFYKEDPVAVKRWLDDYVDSVVTLNPIEFAGPIAFTLTEMNANYDNFKDNPIVPEYMKLLEDRAQYDANTSEAARWLGQIMPGKGMSPMMIDHLVQGSFGGGGRYLMDIASAAVLAASPERRAMKADKPIVFGSIPSNLPIVRAFLQDMPVTYSAPKDRFYKLLERSLSANNTLQSYIKTGTDRGLIADLLRRQGLEIAMYPKIAEVAAKMSELQRMRRAIDNAPATILTPRQKDEKKQEIDAAGNAMIRVIDAEFTRQFQNGSQYRDQIRAAADLLERSQ